MVSLREKILNFEHWISSGFKTKKPNNFQYELLKLFKENKDAYTYYRNHLFRLLLKIEGKEKELDWFINFLDFKKETFAHEQLKKYYLDNKFSAIYTKKLLNVNDIVMDIDNEKLSHSHCYMYQSFYENEIILIVLASFSILNNDNKVDTGLYKFKDRKGNIKKGLVIKHLKSKLKFYNGLGEIFDLAYNVKLRNTIGHNNYTIEDNKIISLDNELIVDKKEFFESLVNIQSLNNYLLYYFSNASINLSSLEKYGILGIGFGYKENSQILSVFQLSCFYNLNINFSWLNKIKFYIRENKLITYIDSANRFSGDYNELTDNIISNLTKNKNRIMINLIPIEPYHSENNLISLNYGDFEVVDDGIDLELDYELIKVE